MYSTNKKYTIEKKVVKWMTAAVVTCLMLCFMGMKGNVYGAVTITTAEQFQNIGKTEEYPLDGDYVLGNDIDFGGAMLSPIGNSSARFSGTFDGAGHTLSGIILSGDVTGTDKNGNEVVGYGLFGQVGSSDKDKPAQIKNLILSNIKIATTEKGYVSAGFLCAVIRDAATIENVAVINSTMEIKGAKKGTLSGAGAIAGSAMLSDGLKTNQYISISDIYADCTIKTSGFISDENTASGIIGCVYDKYIGYIGKVVSIGTVMYESKPGYAIATTKKYDGNGIARKYERCYYIKGERLGTEIDYGIATGVLASGKVALSDNWDRQAGFYPIINIAKNENVISRVAPVMPRKQTYSLITGSFTLPVAYGDKKITWSASSDVISIDGTTGKATIDADKADATQVTLTATLDGESKTIQITVGNKKEIKFSKEYASAGETIKVIGAPAGAVFKWTIKSEKTGLTRTLDNNTDSYTVTEEDLESFITVTVNGSETTSIYVTNLPIVYVNSATAYKNLNKTTPKAASIKICGSSLLYAQTDLYDGEMLIKVRGHYSAQFEKKPYKIKLEEKADLLGLSGYESRHWVLLSNVYDHTFIRNEVVFEYADGLGSETALKSEDVVLIYNGQYMGIFQLCESIRIEEGRTDILEYDEYGEDIAEAIAKQLVEEGKLAKHYEEEFVLELSEIMEVDYSYIDDGYVEYDGIRYDFSDFDVPSLSKNGGYQVSMDFYSDSKIYKIPSLKTAYKLPMYIHSPNTEESISLKSYKELEIFEYAVKFNQSFEYALHSDDFFFRNEDIHYAVLSTGEHKNGAWSDAIYEVVDYTDDENDGKHYSQMFDMDSMVQNFLICELTMNYDSMKNSFYYYKDENELAYMGPFWDHDWTMGNDTYGVATLVKKYDVWHTHYYRFYTLRYYTAMSWNRMLARDPYFLLRVYEKYHETRAMLEEMVREGGYIDQKYEYLKNAAIANDRRWSGLKVGADFELAMYDLDTWLDNRIKWLDEQFADFDTMVKSLDIYKTSDYLSVESVVRNGDKTATITAKAENNDVIFVAFQVNGTYLVKEMVKDGKAVITVPASALTEDGANIVEVKAINADAQYMVNSKYSAPGNYNLIHSEYYVFE